MSRAQATALVVALVPLVWLAMWIGWRGRARRQGDLPPPAVPVGAPVGEPFEGLYVSTTRHGDWLDRVVAHGLGTRSTVLAYVGDDGVVLDRPGARSLHIPVGDLLGAGRTSGMAGTFVERDGLAVITWRLGAAELDTGLRLRRGADTDVLVAAVNALADGSTGKAGQ